MRKWHRWIGIGAAIFLVLVGTTGVILQFQQIFGEDEAIREKLATIHSSYVLESSLSEFVPKLTKAQDTLQKQLGNQELDRVELSLKGDHPTFVFHLGGTKVQRVIVNTENSAIERQEPDERESFLLRLHTGEVFGDPGVVLGIFWGTALIVLTLTGTFLYWQIYRARAKKYGWKKVFWILVFSILALQSSYLRAEDKVIEKTQIQDKNRDSPQSSPPVPSTTSPFSATYVATLNGSTQHAVKPSMNDRLNLDYTLPDKQVFDLRLEYYTEGSYNSSPPGELENNINEPKFEGQLTYTNPLTERFSLSGAVLHHENFRFPDTYWWGILTASYALPLSDNLTFIGNISPEKRFSGGRVFYDFSGTLDYNLTSLWMLEGSIHRYENYGEFDTGPTQKREYELAVIRKLPHQQFVGLSYFNHIQFGAPNDQFSFIKLKYGISF